MAAEWICDGCGKREPGVPTQRSGWRKPYDWFEKNLSVQADGTEAPPFCREPETFKTILSACSRGCIERAASKTGTHSLVLPV